MRNLIVICLCALCLMGCKKVSKNIGEKVESTAIKAIGAKTATLTEKELGTALSKAISVLPPKSQRELIDLLIKHPDLKVFFTENPKFVSTWEYMRKYLPKDCVNPKFLEMFIYANDYASYGGNKLENFIFKKLKDGTIQVLSKDGKHVLATIKPGKVIEVLGDDVNNWFLQLKPLPNVKYVINGTEYATDDLGRVVSSKAKLSKASIGKQYRDSGVQKQMAKLKGSAEGDDAGHIIANQFGGSSNMVNLIPMKGKINKGTYKQMEEEWRKWIDEGKEIKIDINIKYPTMPPGCQRPDWIEVIYYVDGRKITKLFKNVA